LDNRLVIARRELRSLREEKTIVLAIAIQVFIAAFSSFLVVGLVAMYDPSSVPGQGTTVGVTGNASQELADAVNSQDLEAVEYVEYPDYDSAIAAFRRGETDALLQGEIAPNGVLQVVAVAPESSLRTTRTVVQLRDVLQKLEETERTQRTTQLRNQPLPLPGEKGSSPFFNFTYTVLIPLLIFLPVFISGSITSDSITEEYERGTLDLLRVTPTSDRAIIEGKMAAYFAIAPIQAAA